MGLSICTFFRLKNITIFKSPEDLIQFFLVQVVFFKLLSKMHRKNRPNLVSTRSIPKRQEYVQGNWQCLHCDLDSVGPKNRLKQLHGLDDFSDAIKFASPSKINSPQNMFFFVFGSMLFEKKRHQKIPRVSGLPTFKSRSAPSSFSFCFSWLVEVDFGIEMSYCLSFCVMDDESSVSKVTWCGGGPDLGGYMTNNWGWGNQRFL